MVQSLRMIAAVREVFDSNSDGMQQSSKQTELVLGHRRQSSDAFGTEN